MAYIPHCRETLLPIILNHLRNGASKRAAAMAVGVNPDTLYQWLKDLPSLSDEIAKAESEAELKYQGTIDRTATAGTETNALKAAMFWLERRRRGDYGQSLDLNALPLPKLLELYQAMTSDSTDEPVLTAQQLKRNALLATADASTPSEVTVVPSSVLSDDE